MLWGRNIRRTMLLQGASVLAVCAVATGGQAWAQGASDSSILEDVVVTARRAAIVRSSTLGDPDSFSAEGGGGFE